MEYGFYYAQAVDTHNMGPSMDNNLTLSYTFPFGRDYTREGFEAFDPAFVSLWMCLNEEAEKNASEGVQPNNTNSCFSGENLNHFRKLGNTAEYDILKSPAYAMTIVICYIVVICLGALGNIMVVITVVKAKQMWNATNIFIANLAVADIFVCVFDLPLSAYYQITGQWIFGATLCRIIPMVFAMVVYSSTLTLTLIAVDRYMLVVHPLRRRLSTRTALFCIVIIAMVALAVAAPISVYGTYRIYDDPSLNLYKQLCYEHWPTLTHRRVYTILTLLFQYFIPLIIIAILYVRIFLRIRSRVKNRRSSRRTKTTKMLVAVVLVFALAWTPYHIHSILSEYGFNPFGIYYKFADAMLRVLAMSSSCLNPFLYGWLNDNYKNAFLSIVKKPTSVPKGIYLEESDRTLTRSNICQGSPLPSSERKLIKPVDRNFSQENTNTYLAPPERVPLKKLNKTRGGVSTQGKAYHSLAQIENDPKSPVVIVILHADVEKTTDKESNNNHVE